MLCLPLAQLLNHEPEILLMPPLIRGHRDTVRVFLDRSGNDLADRAVVAKVNNLGTRCLQDAPDDIDCSIVTVKEACSRNKAHRVLGPIRRGVI